MSKAKSVKRGVESDIDSAVKRRKEENIPSPEKVVVVDEKNPEWEEFEELDVDVSAQLESYQVVLESFTNVGLNCTHDCIRPKNWVRQEKIERPPAKTYNFKLDNFQAAGINCIENNESVMISAHTSAGKTVIAEYAIALALKNKQRVIYTSPIKALSNQKFRDLTEEFQDVGLLTGDVTLNPMASVIVMTTEILRSMLYRGSELCREVAWVVFDEIHYMRDRERGVVWEETLVLLPDTVRFVFLSATLPNAPEFAEWVCRIKHQPCHVIYTDFRPTPLEHYIYPIGGEGVYKVYDEKRVFLEDNFTRAISSLQQSVEDVATQGKGNKNKKNRQTGKNDIEKLLSMCQQRQYLPIIVFSFSKKDVEKNAVSLKKIDLNTDEEKQLVDEIFNNALATLSEEDKKIPQIQQIIPLLKRGIGLHHGGLLPIVKELIEILFQESLIKVLFATETFSMGVNMPAKTVIFTSIRKWDGKEFRFVNSAEFIQMSGRAGRRGLDDRGLTILMLDEKCEPDVAKSMYVGEPQKIESAFHITYNMLLNLLRVEGADPEYMIRRCFRQFQQHRKALSYMEKAKGVALRLQEIEQPLVVEKEGLGKKYLKDGEVNFDKVKEDVKRLYEIKEKIKNVKNQMHDIMIQPMHISPFMSVGRVVQIKSLNGKKNYGWGVCCSHVRKFSTCKKSHEGSAKGTQVDILLKVVEPINGSSSATTAATTSSGTNGNGVTSTTTPLLAEKEEDDDVVILADGEEATIATDLSKYLPYDPKSDALSKVIVVPCLLQNISAISKIKLQADIVKKDTYVMAFELCQRILQEKYPSSKDIPLLSPIEEMKIKDLVYLDLHKKNQTLTDNMNTIPIVEYSDVNSLLAWYKEKKFLQQENEGLQKHILQNRHLIMKEELKGMRRVLKKMNYVEKVTAKSGKADVVEVESGEMNEKDQKKHMLVTLKGRTACEITTGDEIIVVELLFHNFFAELKPEYCAALLSCLVCDEKCEDQPLPSDPTLMKGFEILKDVARSVGNVSIESRLEMNVDEFVDRFKPHLMEFVLLWCQGKSFGELCQKTPIFEGSIIRCIRRLEELIRQLAAASKSMGNPQLEEKFSQAIKLIRRGIIFASSLYL